MPADALILLSSRRITKKFRRLAQEKGERKWGYAKVVDLSKTDPKLSVILSCDGYRNGMNKIQFIDVAHLGLTRVLEIATEIFGDISDVRIFRIDWHIDIDIPLLALVLYCRIARAQNCQFIHSRSGTTVYLRLSKACTIYMYDKFRQLKAKGDPIAKNFYLPGPWTRIEVQYKGGGLPFRKFKDIKRYGEIDMLADISFWEAGRIPEGSSPMQSLAAEALLRRIDEVGLQMALKMFSAQERAYIVKKFLRPASDSKFPDLNKLMRKRVREWLSDVIRFPRLRPRSRR
jgi:hypothetical protein